MIEIDRPKPQDECVAGTPTHANSPVTHGLARYVGPLTVTALFAAAYYPTSVKLVSYWLANDTYNFGFFIPLLALLMVWKKREQLRQAPWSTSPLLGTLVTGCGLGLLFAGRASATNLVEELSLVLTLSGLILLLFGRSIFRILLFPLTYLLAMIPVWEVFLIRLHPYFQLYSANVGVRALRLFGIPVFRDGTFIHLPNVNLEVAEACSGVNYLIAVICVGLAAGYLFINSWPKRLFIVGAAVVIALLSNGVRVAMVSAFAYHGIPGENGDIHGPFALARSLLISGVGYVALFALITWFADRDATRPSCEPDVHGYPVLATRRRTARMSALIAVLLVGSSLAFDRVWQVADTPLSVSLAATIPSQIGPWESRPWGSVRAEFPELDFDDRLQRQYTTPDGDELSLFVGYLKRQNQGRELAGYKVHQALRADRPHTAVLVKGTEVNDVIVTDGRTSSHITYWYVADNRVLARDFEEKLYSAWRSMMHRRNNGALVVVRAPANALDTENVRTRGFVVAMISLSQRMLAGSRTSM